MGTSKRKVLIIVGMHRSMTSLVAQWLHKCGLHLGDHLYGAGIGNIKGHFEDKDFIGLHDYMLEKNGSHWRDTSGVNFHQDEYAFQKSRMLINLKSELHEQWGWKDPRTCLFLKHWNNIVPEARYLVVYRPFAEVVYSFMRREFKVSKKVQYLIEIRKYASKLLSYSSRKENNLKLWIHYNTKILDFLDNLPKERVLVARNDQILGKSELIYETLTEDWGFELENIPAGTVFDDSITERASSDFMKGVDKKLLYNAKEIQSRLAGYTIS